ncbi:metal homeostatis protein bsd2 [Infundibulicybe gibba]|nr:metal homeostatis protein bsd2 [Infundibulicybe gibba]
MSARYAPLPNPRSASDSQRAELDDAFESDNEEDSSESTPLTRPAHASAGAHTENHQILTGGNGEQAQNHSLPGSYDFEREPSATALPNDFGNSNGLLPSSPVRVSTPQPSIFRRAVGAILPTHYTRVATSEARGTHGGGVENDGVFANVMAKPQVARVVRTEAGDVHIVPEDNQKEAPPSYSDAQADSVPPYWETTVHAPSNGGLNTPDGEMIVEDLPTGSFWVFTLNIFVSFFFQFVGFLLTYILHTSHAGKFGSRAGLGLTLIQYGFYSRAAAFAEEGDGTTVIDAATSWRRAGDSSNIDGPTPTVDPSDPSFVGVTSKDWLSFLFMTLGWFLFLSSVLGFWRVKRWESSIRATAQQPPLTREDLERDRATRRNIAHVFGLDLGEDEELQRRDANGNVLPVPQQVALDEARLARDLRVAGLL